MTVNCEEEFLRYPLFVEDSDRGSWIATMLLLRSNAKFIEQMCYLRRCMELKLVKRNVRKLHTTQMRHWRSTMGIKWQDRIRNVHILQRAGIPSMEQLVANKYLRWAGHVTRMHIPRLPKKILYFQLEHGQWGVARPKLWFEGTFKWNMKFKNIDADKWYKLQHKTELHGGRPLVHHESNIYESSDS